MAVFYDYIKGVDKSGKVITKLYFPKNENSFPFVEINGVDLGEIVTTKGGQTIQAMEVQNLTADNLTTTSNLIKANTIQADIIKAGKQYCVDELTLNDKALLNYKENYAWTELIVDAIYL